jgi:hypothetical protein
VIISQHVGSPARRDVLRTVEVAAPENIPPGSKWRCDRYEELTGTSLKECPACLHGRMVIIEVLKPVKPNPPIDDTS